LTPCDARVLKQSTTLMPFAPTVDDTSLFDGIAELQGEELAGEAKDLLSSSAFT
jgi:hypothetical protein